jgi:spore coat protein U-like protein
MTNLIQIRAIIIIILGVGYVVLSQSAIADSCSITSATGINFGSYDIFDVHTNNNGAGSMSVKCKGDGNSKFVVTLSAGQSNTYSSRVMRSGANVLTYNLYTSAARTVIWGDGTGGSSTISARSNSTTILDLFGQIPAGQDVGVGTYTDSITTTVIF